MATFVADCPCCGTLKITFDLKGSHVVKTNLFGASEIEFMCVCRSCSESSLWVGESLIHDLNKDILGGLELHKRDGNINQLFEHLIIRPAPKKYACLNVRKAPDHLPEHILRPFQEAALCASTQCHNAAGAMFRLCIDLATKNLPIPDSIKADYQKLPKMLGPRIDFLFDHSILDPSLRDLAHAVKEDGNDAIHSGSLTQVEVEDLSGFTFELLSKLYSTPGRIEEAKARRNLRREQ